MSRRRDSITPRRGSSAQLIRRIASEGVAVLLVEHDMGMVMSIADDVVVIDRGKRIARGTPAQVGHDPNVVQAYLGSVHE